MFPSLNLLSLETESSVVLYLCLTAISLISLSVILVSIFVNLRARQHRSEIVKASNLQLVILKYKLTH